MWSFSFLLRSDCSFLWAPHHSSEISSAISRGICRELGPPFPRAARSPLSLPPAAPGSCGTGKPSQAPAPVSHSPPPSCSARKKSFPGQHFCTTEVAPRLQRPRGSTSLSGRFEIPNLGAEGIKVLWKLQSHQQTLSRFGKNLCRVQAAA